MKLVPIVMVEHRFIFSIDGTMEGHYCTNSGGSTNLETMQGGLNSKRRLQILQHISVG